jgi:hypothetical protein
LAAFARRAEAKDLTLTAFFDSNPSRVVTRSLNLAPAQKALAEFAFLDPSRDRDRDTLKLQLSSRDGRTLWSQSIPIVIVREPPRLPAFGATSLKLRFDAPISLRDPKTGAFSTLPYENGWDPKLNDVVVSLPNGARFVFWRGSSYIPFWAGVRNTGLCYEWAEQLNRPADAVDCVEPLMDKELRYSRVKIVESTPARVHVRWRYQSTDLHYKVWGDEAVEDYYFYPDGFGTRVLTLKADPAADYELAELIILAPQEAYPFQVLPRAPITLIGHDGSVHPVEFPVDRAREAETRARVKPPVIYSVSLDPSDPLRAILYNPRDSELAPLWFGHFQEGAEIVTPAYWGSHWPLARGNATGSAIDDRIAVTPSHNSLMSWAKSKPRPVSERLIETHDAQGRARTMIERRWVWLIGMSAESNQELIARSRSFASPPSIALSGARLAFDSAIHERRAIGIEVESPRIEIRLAPQTLIKNPVFELSCAPASQPRVELNGHALPANDFAWDGRVLWINRTIDRETQIIITFPDQDSSR